MIGRSTVTDGQCTEPYEYFSQWPQSEGADTEVGWSHEEKCAVEGYNVINVRKNVVSNANG